MGTRSIIEVVDERNNVLLTMYQQYDGYPEGVGKDLAKFLAKHKLINGITTASESLDEMAANGMGCLAAQIVKWAKIRIGGAYLVPIGQMEEFNYRVGAPKKLTGPASQCSLSIRRESGEQIFNGTVEQFLAAFSNEKEGN